MNIATAYIELRVKSDEGKREAVAETRAVAQQMTKTFAQYFTAAVVVREFAKAGRAASDLQQAVGGTEAVFGKASTTIDSYAKKAAEAAGLSERAFRELTSQIGGLLTGLGFTQDEAARTSVSLAQLGADLAAAFGGRPEEAVQALGAALRGETDPLERFGVSLNQSAVNLKAVELGLATSTSKVDANAKAQATLALISERTANIQGQFGREADTAAGRAATFQAKIENLRAEIGTNLLPVMSTALGILETVTDVFAALPGPVQLAIVALAGIAAVAGPINQTARALGGMSTVVGKLRTIGPGAAAGLGVVSVALVGLGLHAKATADRNREAAESIEDIARAGDDAALGVFLENWGGKIAHDGADALADLARQSLETAVRIRDLAAATGQYPEFVDMMTAAIDKEVAARKQANETTAEGTAKVEALTGATDAATTSTGDLVRKALDLDDAEQRVIAAMDGVEQGVLDAVEAHKELIATLIEAVSSTFDFEQATQDLALSYMDFQEQLLDTTKLMDDSTVSDRDKERALRELRTAEIGLAEKALETARTYATQQGAVDGSAESARLMIDELKRQQDAYPELRDEIQVYIDKLKAVPADVTTKVGALIDDVGFDRAMKRLRELAVAAGNTYTPRVTAPRLGSANFSAEGRYVDRPMISALGEGGRPEVVLPLTKPSRIAELMSDPRVGGPIAAAMGGGGGVDVRVYIGDRELTDIVDVRVSQRDDALAGAISAGRRN